MNEHPGEGGHRHCSTYRLVHRPLGGTRGLPNLCSAHPSGQKDVRLISHQEPLYRESHVSLGLPLTVTQPPGPPTPILPVSDTPRDPSKPCQGRRNPGSPQAFAAAAGEAPMRTWVKGPFPNLGHNVSVPGTPGWRRKPEHHDRRAGASAQPWSSIKLFPSSPFPLWGHLSTIPMPSPPLSLHLGRATGTLLGLSPC